MKIFTKKWCLRTNYAGRYSKFLTHCAQRLGPNRLQLTMSSIALSACIERLARNFAPPAGFESVNAPNREQGGPPTMPAGKKPMLPVTVFTDYI